MPIVIIPYRKTKWINGLFRQTVLIIAGKFIAFGVLCLGALRVVQTENQIEMTITGAIIRAAKK